MQKDYCKPLRVLLHSKVLDIKTTQETGNQQAGLNSYTLENVKAAKRKSLDLQEEHFLQAMVPRQYYSLMARTITLLIQDFIIHN